MRASILKRRRCFLWNARYFQLDLFLGDIVANGSSASSTPTNASMMLLEAYLPKDGAESSVASTNMALLPPFVPVVRDITMDRSYSMFELSAKMSGCR